MSCLNDSRNCPNTNRFPYLFFLVKAVWLVLLLSSSYQLVAQVSEFKRFKFYQLNEKDNLTNTIINDITQDTLGFMWIGTEDGLFRFNGLDFTSFRSTSQNYAISNNTVNKLMVDASNKVWILTNNGLSFYDYQTDSVTNYNPQQQITSPDQKVYTAITSGAAGSVYLGTFGGGLYRWQNGEFRLLEQPISAEEIDIHALQISDLVLQGEYLWIATWNQGLLKLDLLQNQLVVISKESLSISDLFLDSKQQLWAGTNTGLMRTTLTDFNKIKLEEVRLLSGAVNEVLSIFEDEDKSLWVGTRSQGLFQISQKDDAPPVIRQFEPNINSSSIAHRTISKIFQDRVGNIWLGTHSKGLNVFSTKGEVVHHVKLSPTDLITGKNVTSVWGIAPSKSGGLWYGTDGAGLFHYDLRNEPQKIASTEGPLMISHDAILCVKEVANDQLWIGTYAGGINVIDLKTNRVRNYSVGEKNASLLVNDIRVIHQTTDQKIWIGTNRGGLHYYDQNQDQIIPVKGTANLDIRGMINDPRHPELIWMATYGNGLICFNVLEETLTTFLWNTDLANKIPIVLSIAYHHNRIWLGTKEEGVVSFNLNTEQFDSINWPSELQHQTIRSIIPRGDNLWLSTNLGAICYQLDKEQIASFYAASGFMAGQYNDGSGTALSDDLMALGGIHGLDIFNPNDILYDRPLPKIVFTTLRQNNLPVFPNRQSNILNKSVPIADQVNFGPNLSIFSFQLSVLDFPYAQTIAYKYFLEGYDEEWSLEKELGQVSYRHVPPGDYIFQARTVDPVTAKEGPINKISIHIAPPWWRTLYAYGGFAILVFLVFWFLYRYNRERIRMKQSLFYEQKIRQQEQASLQEKIRLYTNFSHELRTPLTLILGPVKDLLAREEANTDKRSSLQMIKRNAQILLKYINSMLEFRKLETNNAIMHIGYHDISILALQELEQFSYQAKLKAVKLTTDCQKDVFAWADVEKVRMLLSNLLSNALKYTEKGKSIHFQLSRTDAQLQIKVSDEGQGIDPKELTHIFKPFYQASNSMGVGGTGLGLSLCKRFVDLHGGTITVESRPQQGSTFIVTMPVGKSHFEGKENFRFIPLQPDLGDQHLAEKATEFITDIKVSVHDKVMLIVDDNVDIRSYLTSFFQESFAVKQARNGKEALQMAKKFIPDIIISDLMMPEMDGLSFCKILKEDITTSHIPILLLTAKAQKEAQIQGFQLGADDYITKPFDSAVLKARVESLLRNRAQLKRYFVNGISSNNSGLPSHELAFMQKVEETVLEILPQGDLSVIVLCRALGFSRTSLYRKVKGLTGYSITQLIKVIRLKRAAELLSAGELNVSEVAFSLDFTDLRYFRTSFKKHYGVLPSEFQKQAKSQHKLDQADVRKTLDL